MSDARKAGYNTFRGEDEPTAEAANFSFALGGLSAAQLGALSGEAWRQWASTGDDRYDEILRAIEAEERRRREEEKKKERQDAQNK
jgi:hypothetical protein